VSTLWLVAGADCVVTDAADATLHRGGLAAILPGLAGTAFDGAVDAGLQTVDGLYLFRGDTYGRYDLATHTIGAEYPRVTAEWWEGTAGTPAASSVTAAARLSDTEAILVSGTDVTLYDLQADAATGVTTIDALFPGIPAGTWVTAAVTTDDALYLFSGDVYHRVDLPARTAAEGYPRAVEGAWPALSGFTPAGGFTLAEAVVDGAVVAGPPDVGPVPASGDPYPDTPARALTVDQAREVLAALEAAGALTLKAASAPHWVSLADPVMHGVTFSYWQGGAPVASALRNLDPRNAVALARLAAWASSAYGVHTIVHIGVNGDDTGGRVDCHGQGRAIDIAGVFGPGAAGSLLVRRDWGERSVPNEADPSGPRPAQWPTGSRALTYRLADAPDADPAAVGFFRDLYAVVAGQWQDGGDTPTGPAPTSEIGTRSFVMHPDHPSSSPTGKGGREAHIDHLHVQIGKTGTQ
jgi:hypothetical protein